MINFYKNTSWLNLATVILIIYFTLWAEDFAYEFLSLKHSFISQNAPYVMNVLAAEIIVYMLLFNRLALAIGLAAGFLWFPAGDVMAMPWWIASMAFLVHTFDIISNDKIDDDDNAIVIGLLLLFWIVGLASYWVAYSGTSHYWYLTGFILLFIVTFQLYVSSSTTSQEGTEPPLQKAYAERAPTGQHPLEHNDEVNIEEGEYAFSAVERPFEEEIVRLESFTFLPEHINEDVQGIIKYARLIQDCILTDPHDVEPGTKFLQRYLPPSLDIIEKGYNLTQRLKKHDSAYELTRDKAQILGALHCAFRQKHAQLLENNATHLQTEMSTLEKLLKTDGFL